LTPELSQQFQGYNCWSLRLEFKALCQKLKAESSKKTAQFHKLNNRALGF
jgi:hypothetical protein